MNADQIAEIRPALREVLDGGPDTCLTLEVTGDSDKWLQITDRTLNAAYPHKDPPETKLKSLLSSPLVREISSWEAGKFVTIEFIKVEVTETSSWIDTYFVSVLGCLEGNYHLDVGFENL